MFCILDPGFFTCTALNVRNVPRFFYFLLSRVVTALIVLVLKNKNILSRKRFQGNRDKHKRKLSELTLFSHVFAWLQQQLDVQFLFAALQGQKTRPLLRAQPSLHEQVTFGAPWSYLTKMVKFNDKNNFFRRIKLCTCINILSPTSECSEFSCSTKNRHISV